MTYDEIIDNEEVLERVEVYEEEHVQKVLDMLWME